MDRLVALDEEEREPDRLHPYLSDVDKNESRLKGMYVHRRHQKRNDFKPKNVRPFTTMVKRVQDSVLIEEVKKTLSLHLFFSRGI